MIFMVQQNNILSSYREYILVEQSGYGRRFNYELNSIIANAIQGDELAASNLLHYFFYCHQHGHKIRPEVITYLLNAISRLSMSERNRLLEGLCKEPLETTSVSDVLWLLPNLTLKAKNRFIKKICSTMGRPRLPCDDCNRIRIGAKVSALHQQYKDRDSLVYEQTVASGIEPLERAIDEIAELHYMSSRTTRRAYELFNMFYRIGSVDSNGEFIFKDLNWLLNEDD